MAAITRTNIQEFCRLCLSHLETLLKSTTTTDNPIEIEKSISHHVNATMNQLISLLTTTKITKNTIASGYENKYFPKHLCHLCYIKLMELEDFQMMIINSSKIIMNILTENPNNSKSLRKRKDSAKENNATDMSNKDVKIENTSMDEDIDVYDSKLLFPELSLTFNNSDEAMETTTNPGVIEFVQDLNHTVKEENISDNEFANNDDNEDKDYDNDDMLADDNHHSSNMDNDDADDEELALSSNAANTSSKSNAATHLNKTSRRKLKRVLKCPRCEKKVYKQVYLDAHIRGVHEGHEKPFLCIECQKAYTRYNQLYLHMQKEHESRAFICEFDDCSAAFKLRTTLETHRIIKHISSNIDAIETLDKNANPAIIKKSKKMKKIIDAHKAQLRKEDGLEFLCRLCSKKYSSKRSLSEHMKRHEQIKEHICQVCGEAKVTRTELQTHMRRHQNLEKFQCDLCPQKFNHKNAVTRHVRVVHEGERRHVCGFCSKRFGTRNSKILHERLHTGERPYICAECNKTYIQADSLKRHMRIHTNQVGNYVCSFCMKSFSSRKNLLSHEERHRGSKPHICLICNRGYSNLQDLGMHLKSHDGEFSSAEGNDEIQPDKLDDDNSSDDL